MKPIKRYAQQFSILLLLATVPLAVSASLESLLAPKSDLWPRWQAHTPDSTIRVDHGPWEQLLERYLVESEDGVNRVNYASLKDKDQKQLDAYLNSLSRTQVSLLSRSEQLAFWINLYNALTVQTVVRYYPVESIRDIDISPGLFADGPWGKPLISIEGEEISLNDIEHRILRPIWNDPRLHYAVNCASIGCPNLAPSAYTTERMEAMLEAGAKDYINSGRGTWWEGKKLGVSSIYVWFKQDFGNGGQGVIDHLRQYANPKLKQQLQNVSDFDDHDYDWRLNGTH